MNYFKRIAVFFLIVCISVAVYWFYWNKNVVRLDLVFTSDGHGHVLPSTAHFEEKKPEIGGLSAVGSYLSGIDYPVLLTDSGDIFQGTAEGVLTKGKIVVELMNVLEYDAVAVGNHEFDFGQDVLRGLSRAAQFSFLGANITETDTGSIPDYAKKNVIKIINGINIGLIGVTKTDMKNLTLEKNIEGIEFKDPAEAIALNVKLLKDEGSKVIVVLSHLGLENDTKIAGKLEGVDIILGGHTHRRLYNPVKIKKTLICQPGCNFMNIGHLKLYFSTAEDKIISYSHRLVPLYIKKYPGIPEVDDIINEMLADVTEKLDEVIGSSKVLLPNRLYGDQKKHGELALGNWQTDIMRDAFETDFAFQNTGGIRGSIPAGDIKVRDIWELSPFGNTLVKMTLTGKQVLELLQYSASQEYSKLQVSGMKIVYNDSLPKGKRVLNVITANEKTGEPEELDLEKEYIVVTNSFLAQGGDGYAVFMEGEDIEEIHILLRDLEIEYISNNSPIKASVEGRLLNVSIEKHIEKE